MASLHKLLSDEGFGRRKPRKKVKFKDRGGREETVALPIYICHDRRSFDFDSSRQRALSVNGSSVFSSRKQGSSSDKSNSKPKPKPNPNPRRDEPAIDDAAIKAMVAILSGYAGQYVRDVGFRRRVGEKCRACFERRRKKHSDSEVFAHLELGIRGIEKLVQTRDLSEEMDLESLQKSIKILKIVASLDSKGISGDDSSLAACAHLYLSIVYKVAKNDKISARHLLHVFNESPNLARTHLLPELWDHFFLPHLLHLKIWYNKEVELLTNSGYQDNERRIRPLQELYNQQLDNGTAQFAVYYLDWLKLGAQAPPVPSVPLPPKPRTRRKSMDSSGPCRPSGDQPLDPTVFGPRVRGRSMELGVGYASSNFGWVSDVDVKHHSEHVEKKPSARRISSNQSYRVQKIESRPQDPQKSDNFRFLGCWMEPVECLVQERYDEITAAGPPEIMFDAKIKHDENDERLQLLGVSRDIATICSSESLYDCEMAIRAVSNAWMNTQGDAVIETALSQASVIQGIMEVLYVSTDDEVLELALSILAELANKNEMNRQCILNSDPKLEILLRLLGSSGLFLKAAALLYLVKPKGKQMVSAVWIPLVLRVLEFGDQLQTLFSVRCNPHEAAYYFLDQLLTGFEEDKNFENARQVSSLGGLGLLLRRMDAGNTSEKSKAAVILHHCIRADGSCRHYLAKNLRKEIIFSLLAQRKQPNSHQHALALLIELLCLNKRSQRMEFLIGLKKGWNCLNSLHIFLLLLQRGRQDDRPIVAVILLLLELTGDPPLHSVYRDEAIDAIVKALNCNVLDENVQVQSARALLILAGQFSYTGEPEMEKWLLRKACGGENVERRSGGKDSSINGDMRVKEESKAREKWQRNAAMALLPNTRLLITLSDSIQNSIPCLARASLVTVCWMSSAIQSKDIQIKACSILAPKLMDCLNDNAAFEDKILASLALHSLTKGTDHLLWLSRLEKGIAESLHKLSRVTWAARELTSVISSNSQEQAGSSLGQSVVHLHL